MHFQFDSLLTNLNVKLCGCEFAQSLESPLAWAPRFPGGWPGGAGLGPLPENPGPFPRPCRPQCELSSPWAPARHSLASLCACRTSLRVSSMRVEGGAGGAPFPRALRRAPPATGGSAAPAFQGSVLAPLPAKGLHFPLQLPVPAAGARPGPASALAPQLCSTAV